MKSPKILYFIKGTLPSDEAYDVADNFGTNVAFRNVDFIVETNALEDCDGVAGEVPAAYAKKYPTAEKALEQFKVERKKAAELKKAKRDKGKGENNEVDSHELPDISDGARTLIKENEISDEVLKTIKPTGSKGFVKSDIEKYLEEQAKAEEPEQSKDENKSEDWKPNA